MECQPPKLIDSRRTWTTDSPLYWSAYATEVPGSFNREDMQRFNDAAGKYILFADHRYPDKPREFIQYMLQWHMYFIAGKVTKVARDGELAVILLAYGDEYWDYVKDIAKNFNLFLWRFKTDLESKTDQENETNKLWAEHILKTVNSLRIE